MRSHEARRGTLSIICRWAWRGLAGLAPLLLFCATARLGAQEAPRGGFVVNAELAARGREQFQQTCAFCHGPDATGGRAPDLVRSQFVRDDRSGAAVSALIHSGRPQLGMPAFPSLTADQVAALVEFLHSRVNASILSMSGPGSDYAASHLLTGNAAAGRVYFFGRGGCAACHSPSGDLAGVASRLSAVGLQQQMLYPRRRRAAKATVTQRSGEVVSGPLLRQDEFTVALRDAAGWYRSFPRDEVRVSIHDPLAAHRALLETITQKEMHDVYAFLATLKSPAETTAGASVKRSGRRRSVAEGRAPRPDREAGIMGLDPSVLLRPATTTWGTYNGDYSGRRYSSLRRINAANIAGLHLAWVFHEDAADLKSTPLEVHGILYFTVPDYVWAVDARTGEMIWQFHWASAGGDMIGNRGVAMDGDRLYFTTPDAHLVCLDARDGAVRWQTTLVDFHLGYFSTMAPLLVRNHLIVGVSGDVNDMPGVLDSFDPLTGKLQWQWHVEPAAGEVGADTWPNAQARSVGGGMTWMTGTYDPKLNLLYWGTGNPNPVLDGASRAGADLFTCSIVALNPDTGKLVWYYQTSPHDEHDWDAVETPVLFDAIYHGRRRQLLAQASRNGFYFLLDRRTGQHLATAPFIDQTWAAGVDAAGHAIPRPDRVATPDGTLVEPGSDGATNWMAPSFDPQTGLFYVVARRIFSVFYLTETGKPEGWAGRDFNLWSNSTLRALDYRTGKVVWDHELGPEEAIAGVLTTAGGLLFTADNSGHLLALDAATGKTLWSVAVGAGTQNSPMTYLLDGRQYLVMAAGGSLYAFSH